MSAVIFGLLTAVAWTVSILTQSRAVRIIDQGTATALAMLTGLLVMAPFLVSEGVPHNLIGTNLAWWAVSGLGNICGLLLSFAALRVGKVGLVAPITSTEGAIIATLSVVAGASVAPQIGFVLALIAAGVVLAAIAPDPAPIENERPVRAVALAVVAACSFGVGGFATGHLSGLLPVIWVAAPPRVVGCLLLFLPLLASRRLARPGRALPLIVACGLAEVVGWFTFVLGARQNVVVSSVLAGLFAPFGAMAAFFLFREKLGGLQVSAMGLLLVTTTALTLLMA